MTDFCGGKEQRCPRCGKAFACGGVAGQPQPQPQQSACWCAALPVLQGAAREATACYCPDCLRALLAAQAIGGGAPAP